MKKILLENDEVKIEMEDGIVIANWKTPIVDLKTAQRAVKYRLECTDYVSLPLISNIKLVKNSAPPAREFLASEKGCEGISILAIVVNSPLSKIIGNFFLHTNKPIIPTKIFTNETAAKKWLIQL